MKTLNEIIKKYAGNGGKLMLDLDQIRMSSLSVAKSDIRGQIVREAMERGEKITVVYFDYEQSIDHRAVSRLAASEQSSGTWRYGYPYNPNAKRDSIGSGEGNS